MVVSQHGLLLASAFGAALTLGFGGLREDELVVVGIGTVGSVVGGCDDGLLA